MCNMTDSPILTINNSSHKASWCGKISWKRKRPTQYSTCLGNPWTEDLVRPDGSNWRITQQLLLWPRLQDHRHIRLPSRHTGLCDFLKEHSVLPWTRGIHCPLPGCFYSCLQMAGSLLSFRFQFSVMIEYICSNLKCSQPLPHALL